MEDCVVLCRVERIRKRVTRVSTFFTVSTRLSSRTRSAATPTAFIGSSGLLSWQEDVPCNLKIDGMEDALGLRFCSGRSGSGGSS
jgi:hypothetical protein